jgi:hypothetical protein
MASCPPITPMSSISTIFPAIRNRMPTGAYLEKQHMYNCKSDFQQLFHVSHQAVRKRGRLRRVDFQHFLSRTLLGLVEPINFFLFYFKISLGLCFSLTQHSCRTFFSLYTCEKRQAQKFWYPFS